jgi:hypothetical protein
MSLKKKPGDEEGGKIKASRGRGFEGSRGGENLDPKS